jgi:ADP-ribose pyrophosphatase
MTVDGESNHMTKANRETKETKILYDGKHVRLVSRGGWEYAQRKGVTGIVAILAVTDDGKLILVEQYRPPVGKWVIELPAGLAGDVAGQETEELAAAARRELLEETGYEAGEMIYLAEGAASAGITDEVITLFRATGLQKTGTGEGDGSEDITVHEVPLADVRRWLEERRTAGSLIDLKVFAGLYFA